MIKQTKQIEKIKSYLLNAKLGIDIIENLNKAENQIERSMFKTIDDKETTNILNDLESELITFGKSKGYYS